MKSVIGGLLYYRTGDNIIDKQSLHSVDIYSGEHDRGRSVPPLPEVLYGIGATVLDGSLYACGMVESRKVVVYRLPLSQSTSTWILVEPELSHVLHYACVGSHAYTQTTTDSPSGVDTFATSDYALNVEEADCPVCSISIVAFHIVYCLHRPTDYTTQKH